MAYVTGTLTNSNYTVASTTSGSWTVNPAPVNVTAYNGSSTYGSLPVNAGLSATGLQNGQSVSVLTGLSNGITNTSNAGGYTVNVAGTLTNPNYTVAGTTGGSWTVNPAFVIVTALGGSSTFGSSPANPGLSATGLQNGQNVSVLLGLRSSFGIASTSSIGSYAVEVTGTLANPNYRVASTNNGSWIVNPVSGLRGSYIPGLSAAVPSNADASLLNGLANAAEKVSAENGSVSGRGALPARAGPGVPASDPNGIFPASPAPVSVSPPAAGASPQIATNFSAILNGPCPGSVSGDAVKDVMASDSGVGSEQSSRGCGRAVPKKSRGLIDFALSKLNRGALAEAINRDFSELTNFRSGSRAVLTTVLAGTSLGLTVGFVSWLLRGGALLSALLSSMPLWRGFDPLPILMRPTRRDQEEQAPSDVDRLFDDADASNYSTGDCKS
jgi:hypothetical protein